MQLKEHKLKNGSKIIGAEIDGAKTFTIALGFGVGSRAESAELAGISHFLEHMFFKGSKNRPRAKDISIVIDRIGANYNAFTSKEYTYYYVNTATENFELALDVLGDMVTSPIIDAVELEKEKGTVIEEIRMYEDNPMFSIYGKMEQTLFGTNLPLGREIAGSEETVRLIDAHRMRQYYNSFYEAKNSVAVLAGNLPKGYEDKIKKYLDLLPSGKKSTWEFSGFSKNKLSIINRKTEQAHFGICFPAFSLLDRKKYAVDLLSTILGGYMSSRLFTEIREKRGWAYRVSSYNDSLSDTGYLGIYGGVKIDKIYEAINIAKEQSLNLAKTITNEEITRAKSHLIGSSALRYESSYNLAVQLGLSYLLLGKPETPAENIENIKKVTREDLVRVSEEIFKHENIYLTVIGPFKGHGKFANIII